MNKKGTGDLVTCGGSLVILAVFGFFIMWLIGPSRSSQAVQKPVKTTQQLNIPGTINAIDSTTGIVINPVNIFKDYQNRDLGIAGKTSHGEEVTIIERSGQGVKIRTSSGSIGWVSSWFVKET